MGGDASTRAYERLRLPDGATRGFMDQPPTLETAVAPPNATPKDRVRAFARRATASTASRPASVTFAKRPSE